MGPARIPEHFQGVTIEQIQRKVIRDTLIRYGQNFWEAASRGIAPMFLGPPSVYKSFAAAALSQALHHKVCIQTDWCNVPITLNQLERRRFERSTDEQIEQWKESPFLVIDDFGMIRMDGWQYNTLVEIAMHRFDAARPTCWTGNIEIDGTPTLDAVEDALRSCVGVQLTRRLLERSEGYRVYVR